MRRRRQSREKRALASEMRDEPTAAENLLWLELKRGDANFTRQWIIKGYIVDFCCRSAGLVVEVDGDVHDTPEQVAHDVLRTKVIESEGFRVARFRNDDVFADAPRVAAQIRALLKTC